MIYWVDGSIYTFGCFEDDDEEEQTDKEQTESEIHVVEMHF